MPDLFHNCCASQQQRLQHAHLFLWPLPSVQVFEESLYLERLLDVREFCCLVPMQAESHQVTRLDFFFSKEEILRLVAHRLLHSGLRLGRALC